MTNIRTHLSHIIQHAQAAERGWDAAQSRVTAEAIAAIMEADLEIPYSRRKLIPPTAAKIASLLNREEQTRPTTATRESVDGRRCSIAEAKPDVNAARAQVTGQTYTAEPHATPSARSQAGAPDYTAMSGPEMLSACRDDASKWATAFVQHMGKLELEWKSPWFDEGYMIGWFANAIEQADAVRRWKRESQAGAFVPTEDHLREMAARMKEAKYGHVIEVHITDSTWPSRRREADAAFAYAQECGAIEPSAAEPPAATVGQIAAVLIRRTNPNWREWAHETAREIAALTTRA